MKYFSDIDNVAKKEAMQRVLMRGIIVDNKIAPESSSPRRVYIAPLAPISLSSQSTSSFSTAKQSSKGRSSKVAKAPIKLKPLDAMSLSAAAIASVVAETEQHGSWDEEEE